MIQLSPWKPKRRLPIYALLLLWLSLHADGFSDLCGGLRCLQNSPCLIETDGHMTSATCLCPQGWVGHRCQGQLHLSASSISMTTVTLHTYVDFPVIPETDLKDSERGIFSIDTSSIDENLNTDLLKRRKTRVLRQENVQSLKYSIHYWVREHSTQCNIVQHVNVSDVTISGLYNDTEYTICAKTNPDEWCNFELDLVRKVSDVAYCVHIRTRSTPLPPEPLSVPLIYIILVSCIALLSLIALLIIISVSIRKKYFSVLICAKKNSQGKTESSYRSHKNFGKSEQDDEFWRLTSPSNSTNPSMTVRPPNCPGKPPSSLVKNRMRGYAAFSAKNEQTIALTTVIEYTTPDDSIMDEWYEDETPDTMETVLPGSIHTSLGTFHSVSGMHLNNDDSGGSGNGSGN